MVIGILKLKSDSDKTAMSIFGQNSLFHLFSIEIDQFSINIDVFLIFLFIKMSKIGDFFQ